MSIAQSRAAFLGKDGTIVEDAPYNVDPDRMRLMPGVAVGRRQPQTAGFLHPHRSVPAYAVECGCRKPAPGLLIPAPAALDIDLARSWFIGDILNDGEAGRRAGCHTVLLDNGHETEWVLSPERRPHFVERDLDKAARLIIAVEATTPAGAGELALVGGKG